MTDIFKVGDKVKCVNNHGHWLGRCMCLTQILDVVGERITDRDCTRVWVDDVNLYPDDFILYSRQSVDVAVAPFALNLSDDGKTVVGIGVGLTYETSDRDVVMSMTRSTPDTEFGVTGKTVGEFLADQLSEAKLTQEITARIEDSAELGVYRPNLEDRKIGKVRVELVDDGFPLALREIAKVMSWAQVAKGYKDHDWQNLPNAELSLAAAASRHRTDHIRQRVVDGLPIRECVDHESELFHKAHEAFGVLAQLELMLRGAFDDRTSD